jgi:hypothetical protein
MEALQKQRAVLLQRLVELCNAAAAKQENVALAWLTRIRPVLVEEFGVEVLDANKEYVYELLSGFSSEVRDVEERKKAGAPSKQERATMLPSLDASLAAAQQAWREEKRTRAAAWMVVPSSNAATNNANPNSKLTFFQRLSRDFQQSAIEDGEREMHGARSCC